jgi:hypothetical protein
VTGPGRDEEMRDVAREIIRELVPGVLREVIAGSATPGSDRGTSNGRAAGDGGIRAADRSASDGDRGQHRARSRELDEEAKVVPQVPAPPVAAVLRPSTWNRPPAPGEIIGSSAPPQPGTPLSPGPQPGVPAATPVAQPGASISPSANSGGDARVETVAVDTDEDLARFVRQLMSRLENPRDRLAIRTGRLQFRLRRSPAPAAAGAAGRSGPVTRVEKGAVTERVIRAAAAAGARLVLGPGAVLTPLAREQAKALDVEIERERRC